MHDGLTRSALLRGGAAIAATGLAASAAAPATAGLDRGLAPEKRIKRAYRRETARAGGTWCTHVTIAREGAEMTVVSERADVELRAASVNKLAMAVAVLACVDRGDLDLAQRVDLTPDAITSGSGSSGMWFLHRVYGDQLTLANVLTTLVLLSEDSALPLIARVLPAGELNAILSELGFEVTRVEPDTENPGSFFHGFTTPREMHSLLTRLASGELLSAELSSFLLDIVRWSEPGYTDGVRRNMSSEERSRVASKYGAYEDRRLEVGMVFDRRGAPGLTFSFMAYGLSDEENYGATHPAVEARAAFGRTLLESVEPSSTQ